MTCCFLRREFFFDVVRRRAFYGAVRCSTAENECIAHRFLDDDSVRIGDEGYASSVALRSGDLLWPCSSGIRGERCPSFCILQKDGSRNVVRDAPTAQGAAQIALHAAPRQAPQYHRSRPCLVDADFASTSN